MRFDDEYSIVVLEDLRKDSPHAKLMREFLRETDSTAIARAIYPRLSSVGCVAVALGGIFGGFGIACIIHEVRRKSLKALPKKQAGNLPEKQSVF